MGIRHSMLNHDHANVGSRGRLIASVTYLFINEIDKFGLPQKTVWMSVSKTLGGPCERQNGLLSLSQSRNVSDR